MKKNYIHSIMGVPMDECYVCGSYDTEYHHVMYGTGQKEHSTTYGLIVPLCPEHHRGNAGVHQNRVLDKELKELAQKKMDDVYGAYTSFFKVFGKNFIYDEVEK